MSKYIIFPATRSPALLAASDTFKRKGYGVVDRPCEGVSHLLLPVPSLDGDGMIRGGGNPEELLAILPKNICIIGGNLPEMPGYRCIDLLKDPKYLADNAYITAHCAIRIAMTQLKITLRGCRVLIIGWGRIGKCLTRLLRSLEAEITVAARKETDRAMAHALGYHAIDIRQIPDSLDSYHLILNTVPHPILTEEQTAECAEGCIKIDLASVQGLMGRDVIWARGLPGIYAPESSGALIARSAIRLM